MPRSNEFLTAAGTWGKAGDGVECVRKKDAESKAEKNLKYSSTGPLIWDFYN